MKPLVSIIVPAYNEEKTIGACLASIEAQSYKPLEVIVVDDGSTDNTLRIVGNYVDSVYSQEHLGTAEARNLGVKKAKGEILVFIDADMALDKEYVSCITKPILQKKAEATFTKEEYVANEKNIWSKCFMIDNDLLNGSRISQKYPNRTNKFRAITKELFNKSSGYLTNYGYGEDTFLRNNVAMNAEGAICYHYNPDTLQDVFFSARWIGRSKNMRKNFENILKYSIINSFKIGIEKILAGAPKRFMLYKITFDLGILIGILKKGNYAK